MRFRDVIPMAIGIRVCGANVNLRSDDLMDIVIPKNTPYPCEFSVTKYTAKANQTHFELDVIQGETVQD